MKEICRIGLKGSEIKNFKILPKGFIFRHLFWRHLLYFSDSHVQYTESTKFL